MAKPSAQQSGSPIDRRKVLMGLGVVATTGLAGCGSANDGDGGDTDDGDGGDTNDGSANQNDLGERVPGLAFDYWTGQGTVTYAGENAGSIISDNIQQNLGLSAEINTKSLSASAGAAINDERVNNGTIAYYVADPTRLDPQELFRSLGADYAGANGQANFVNWADCAFTETAVNQQNATSVDERREYISQGHGIFSKDRVWINLHEFPLNGAYREDLVNISGIGAAGLVQSNTHWLIQSEHTDGDPLQVRVAPDVVATNNFPQAISTFALTIWNRLIFSPLLEYDENLELTNVLAEDVVTENDAKRFVVTLRDATFHDGSPITADDVKFTFELLNTNADVYTKPQSQPYDSIDVVDDVTVEFNLTESKLPLRSRAFPRWGILPREIWEPAMDNPQEFNPEALTGSGPYQVTNFDQGNSLSLQPYKDHPVYDPKGELVLVGYSDSQSALQAMNTGQIQILPNVPPGLANRISESDNNSTVSTEASFQPFTIFPQCSYAPMMFPEFRDAIGKVIDRQAINQVAFRGQANPFSTCSIWVDNHPFFDETDVEKFTESMSGDAEAAKQVLRNQGWGWDDGGNLRYPADADLSPRWPKGEQPQPEDYPCINAEGNYQG